MKFEPYYFVFDLETGGLNPIEHPVLEIAICVLDSDLNETEEYSSKIKPYGNYTITEGALKANGLSVEMLNFQGKNCDVVCNKVEALLKKYKNGKNKPILCGHNIKKFDIPFLEEFFKYNKKNLSKYIYEEIIDTLFWSRVKWQESVNYKLGTCCSNADIELVDAHRALSDTRANKDLVKQFIRNLRNDNGQTKSKEERYRNTFEF